MMTPRPGTGPLGTGQVPKGPTLNLCSRRLNYVQMRWACFRRPSLGVSCNFAAPAASRAPVTSSNAAIRGAPKGTGPQFQLKFPPAETRAFLETGGRQTMPPAAAVCPCCLRRAY